MKNIIVPIDFSSESLNGLKMAILFSQKEKISIHLLYVIQKNAETDKQSYDTDQKLAESKFEGIIKDFKSSLGQKSEIHSLITQGRIFQEVVDLANKWDDALITTSTHGASGFQEFFIGSNAFKIISATDKPVISLRKNSCPSEIQRIVLPIDLSADTRQKVPFTTELAQLFDAEIHVVGIHTSRSKQDIKKLRSYVSQVAGYIEGKVRVESNEVFGDNSSELVVNFANTIKGDLIAITTEQSSGLSLILGNTAHLILNRAEIPVLCLTPKQLTRSGSFASMGG